MLEVMRMSSKSWHEFAGTAPSQKAEPPTPPAEDDKPPQATPPAELDPKVVSAKQHELYMHACMLFYYFMHLDNAQRGDPMLTFLDEVTDNVPKWELFTKALTTYLERLNGYKVSWDAFAALPGVTRLPDGKINYPATMKPPVAPKPPRAPVDTDKLKSLDRSFAYIDVLIKGRSDEDLMKAFKAGFAKIGIEID